MPPRDDASTTRETLGDAAVAAAKCVVWLDPGPLAALRRMETGIGAPAFWRLASRHRETIGKAPERWMPVVRMLAILSPPGERDTSVKLHDPNRRLGAVLCDGGDPGWPDSPTDPQPVFSEARLAQLMTARGARRVELLESAMRRLARGRRRDSGVNVQDIAKLALYPHDTNLHFLARPYYDRLDRADQRAASAKQEPLQEGTD